MAWYLKVVSTEPALSDGLMRQVALPNREISLVYKKEILNQLSGIVPLSLAISIQEALFSGNASRQSIQQLLLESVSTFDTAGENFYHGMCS